MGSNASSSQIAQQMQGAIIKDKEDDRKKLAHYLDVVIRDRAKKNKYWQGFFDTGRKLWMK